MARKNDKTETAAPAKDDKAANKAATAVKKGVKTGSPIRTARTARNLTLSYIQKQINLEKDHGRHTPESRALYRDYRKRGLLGPIAA